MSDAQRSDADDGDDDDLDPVVEAYKRDVDLTLLRRNLQLTPTQRVEQLIELQRFAEELRRAGERARGKAR